MLWILSGSYHSGKNTFRNILVEEYGFKVINKYVLGNTTGFSGAVDFCVGRGTTERRVERRAKRDPYLIEVNAKKSRRGEALKAISEADEAKRQDLITKEEFSNRIIYDKAGTDYYCIEIDDIDEAVGDKDRHYLLVCSDPKIIRKVKSRDSAQADSIRTIMLFGMNLPQEIYEVEEERKPLIAKATEKIGDFFKSSVYTKIDFVLCNKWYEKYEERKQNLIDQWEALTCSLPHRPYRLKNDNNGNIGSTIFFVKPFPKYKVDDEGREIDYSVPKGRANKVYSAINKIITTIADKDCCRYYNYVNPDEIGVIGGEKPAHTVEYTSPEYPQEQMRNQIQEANLVIVDVADIIFNPKNDEEEIIHNPNCYWEVGYARALNKEVLLIVDRKAFPIPFDESDSLAFPYFFNADGELNFDESTTGLTFEGEIEKYYKKLKFAAENRSMHLSLMNLIKDK